MENEQLNNCSRNNYSFTSVISLLFLQTQNAYERDSYEQGYDVEVILDSDEVTEQEEEAMEEAKEDEDNND